MQELLQENHDLRAHIESLAAQNLELQVWKRAHLTPVKEVKRASFPKPNQASGKNRRTPEVPMEVEVPPRRPGGKALGKSKKTLEGFFGE